MNIQEIIISQYQAALEMLKQTLAKCPDSLWDSPSDKTRVWNIAYHALFYTHFYLQDTAQSFTPWSKHRKDYHRIHQVPQPPPAPQFGEPYDKESLLEYLAFCQRQVAERVPHLDFESPSGFEWLPFDKLELQIYTIRHLQGHTGELMERLGTRADVEIDWVGMKHG
jgi:hypothetical protein